MVCGTGSSLTVPSSPSETSVVCFADIRDDPTALENDERSSIRAVPRSVTGAEPVNEQFTAVVIDDDGMYKLNLTIHKKSKLDRNQLKFSTQHKYMYMHQRKIIKWRILNFSFLVKFGR